ncbi:hypothetical protein DM860_013005 [Cuscuta australis]|uniref:DNA-binding protein BIN4 n=1 Tax=Cuscuta australis TaxID=267555 RepID=A0A328D346_9ASTE|nr:hypothetical protein DM860_013005 [Cuscuta australis]
MTKSRDESPDWLRSFQAPTITALSSGSASPSSDCPLSEDDDGDDGLSLGKLFCINKSNKTVTENNQNGDDSLIKTPSIEKFSSKNERFAHTLGKRKRESQPGNEGEDVADIKFFSKRKTKKKSLSPEVGSAWPIKLGWYLWMTMGDVLFGHEPKHSALRLSADYESCPDTSAVRKDNILDKDLHAHNEAPDMKPEGTKDLVFLESDEESTPTKKLKLQSPTKQMKKENYSPKKKKAVIAKNDDVGHEGTMDAQEEDIPEKRSGPQVSNSSLPLLLPEKVQRLKALVECDGDSIDLSGDVGTIYKTTIVPSRTFCVVSFGQSEAKIEAIMNDFIQLTPQSNVYEAETMVEGTLDGFSFDSEEDDSFAKKAGEDKQNETIDDETTGKTKRKARKSFAAEQKNGKAGGSKLPKKVKKKAQGTKKNKKK